MKQNAGALGRAILREEEVGRLKSRVEAQAGFGELIGKDPKMQVVYKLIEDVASSDATVLIQGESGTGKELVARAIHRLSPRQDKPFVVINCSAYPAPSWKANSSATKRAPLPGPSAKSRPL